MAVIYRCDQCGGVAESLAGWFQVDVTSFSMVDVPFPNTKSAIGNPAPFYFDKVACRDAWLTERGIPLPVETPPVVATVVGPT